MSQFTHNNPQEELKPIISSLIEDYVSPVIDSQFSNACSSKIPREIYALHFEKFESEKQEIFCGFILDNDMQKSFIGSWVRNKNTSYYNFWLSVLHEIKLKGMRKLTIANTKNHFWLDEAAEKVFQLI